MGYFQAILMAVVGGTFIAVVYHAGLAARWNVAVKQGRTELVPTDQADLARLDVICAGVVLAALAFRGLQGIPAGVAILYAPMLFVLPYTTMVWWRYPDAIPWGVLPVQADWRGSLPWLVTALRWFTVPFAGAMSVGVLYIVVFVRQ